MSNRFQAPSVEELAARGLDKDGNPIKKAAPKKTTAKKETVKKTGDK